MPGNIWRMWVSNDVTMSYGTFFEFHPNGSIERVTINLDGIEDRYAVTLAETVI